MLSPVEILFYFFICLFFYFTLLLPHVPSHSLPGTPVSFFSLSHLPLPLHLLLVFFLLLILFLVIALGRATREERSETIPFVLRPVHHHPTSFCFFHFLYLLSLGGGTLGRGIEGGGRIGMDRSVMGRGLVRRDEVVSANASELGSPCPSFYVLSLFFSFPFSPFSSSSFPVLFSFLFHFLFILLFLLPSFFLAKITTRVKQEETSLTFLSLT